MRELVSIVYELIDVLHDETVEIDRILSEVEQVTTHLPEVNMLSAASSRLVELRQRAEDLLEEMDHQPKQEAEERKHPA